MKKTRDLIFLTIFFSLFLFPSFSNAQYESDMPVIHYSKEGGVASAIFDPVKDMFMDWEAGKTSDNIAKYLFWILLTVLIFAVSEFIPFLKGISIRWIFSVIVGFLSTAYLTPDEVKMALVSYGAMGLILGAIIPFMIIFFFSYEVGKHPSPAAIVLQYALWVGFGVFLVYKLIMGLIGDQFGWGELIAYGVILLITSAMVFGNKKIRSMLFKAELDSKIEAAKRDIEKRKASRDIERAEGESRGIE